MSVETTTQLLRHPLAVLPFLNLSDDTEKEYFADGMTEDIIAGLSIGRHLAVKSRSTTFAYKTQARDAREIGKALNVKYVVDGSVRPVGERVRITVQLVEAASGDQVWAEKYDQPSAELFEIQDDVIANITTAVGANISRVESTQATRQIPTSLSAWEAVQRAPFFRDIDGNSAEAINQSIEELRHAVVEAPTYAYAHSMLAWLLYMRVINSLSHDPDSDIGDAKKHLAEGMSLGDRDPYNMNLCAAAFGYGGEFERSLELCDRALEIDPNFADVYFTKSYAYMFSNRFEEAEAALDIAEKRAPDGQISRYYGWYRALLRLREGRFPETETLARRTLAMAPRYTTVHYVLAVALAGQGKVDEAKAVVAEALQINPDIAGPQFMHRVDCLPHWIVKRVKSV